MRLPTVGNEIDRKPQRFSFPAALARPAPVAPQRTPAPPPGWTTKRHIRHRPAGLRRRQHHAVRRSRRSITHHRRTSDLGGRDSASSSQARNGCRACSEASAFCALPKM